jgi:hypothetical protein
MSRSSEHGALVEAIKHAFASGETASGEELLATALETGLPWDVATRAAADGIARRYGAPRTPPGPRVGSFALL